MGYDEVSIERSYTESNVVSDNGVCKMHMSSMDSTTAADVYTKGQDMKFFSRYGYCDGTYTGTKHFAETTFESDRSCPEGSVDSGYPFPIYTEEECAFYTGKDVTVISDMTQPYGCWSDGTFNEFNREEDLTAASIDTASTAAKDTRKQELLYEWGNLTARLNAYSISETVPDFVPENITSHSPGVDGGTLLQKYQYQQTVVRTRLQNIAEQINSAWAKFKYLRDLNAQLDDIDKLLLDMKADVIAYGEVVEKLKLYDVTKSTIFNLFFGLGSSIRNTMEAKVASLNFASEVTALENLLDVTQIYTDYMDSYNNIKNGVSAGSEYAWCMASFNHRVYTTIIGDTGVNMQCFPSDKNGLYCGSSFAAFEFRGFNVTAPCGGGTVNYGFPEYGDDVWYESALVKLGLKTKFIVDGSTSFKYLGTREPMESEFSQERYEGIHHMPDFRSIYEALQIIQPDWKDLRSMGDYTIVYEVPDETLAEVDREKRVEARELSWSNIRARETAIARALLNGNANDLVIDPLYESLVKLNHKCVNCQCYNMLYNPNNDKPDDIRADCKEQCVGHDGFLLYWDTSQQRDVSQRDRHRSSCVCAGDGEPVSELECVLSNREWKPNIYTDQYELNAKDPTVKTGVQTKDVYLHCPGYTCSNNGCQEGCKPGFLEEDCSCGDSACKAGQYCTKDGVCKDVVKKEKKFLQIRYNSLE